MTDSPSTRVYNRREPVRRLWERAGCGICASLESSSTWRTAEELEHCIAAFTPHICARFDHRMSAVASCSHLC